MSIVHKVKEVETVFASLENEMNSLRQNTGLHCDAGCGKCCFKADIEATPLEFLPYALHLIEHNEIELVYEKVLANKSSICLLFTPLTGSNSGGKCSQYKYRGLICRLFGYSAVRDKHGETKLVTCAVMKAGQKETIASLEADIKKGVSVPMMSDYYFQLRSIDPDLGTKMMPINQAIREALEIVMAYYAYREPPTSGAKLSA